MKVILVMKYLGLLGSMYADMGNLHFLSLLCVIIGLSIENKS